jgi:hypothetical protein
VYLIKLLQKRIACANLDRYFLLAHVGNMYIDDENTLLTIYMYHQKVKKK